MTKNLDSLGNASFWEVMQKVKSSYMISRRRLCCWVLSVYFALWTPPVRCHSCFQTQTQATPGRINIWPCIYKKCRLPGKQNHRLHKDSPEIQTELMKVLSAGGEKGRRKSGEENEEEQIRQQKGSWLVGNRKGLTRHRWNRSGGQTTKKGNTEKRGEEGRIQTHNKD